MLKYKYIIVMLLSSIFIFSGEASATVASDYWNQIQSRNLNSAQAAWDRLKVKQSRTLATDLHKTPGVDDCNAAIDAVKKAVDTEDKSQNPPNPLAGCLNIGTLDWNALFGFPSIYDIIKDMAKSAMDQMYQQACNVANTVLNAPANLGNQVIYNGAGIIGGATGTVTGGLQGGISGIIQGVGGGITGGIRGATGTAAGTITAPVAGAAGRILRGSAVAPVIRGGAGSGIRVNGLLKRIIP